MEYLIWAFMPVECAHAQVPTLKSVFDPIGRASLTFRGTGEGLKLKTQRRVPKHCQRIFERMEHHMLSMLVGEIAEPIFLGHSTVARGLTQ